MRERRNSTTEVSVSLDDNNWCLKNLGHFISEKNIHKKQPIFHCYHLWYYQQFDAMFSMLPHLMFPAFQTKISADTDDVKC